MARVNDNAKKKTVPVHPKEAAQGWKPPLPEAVTEPGYMKLVKGMNVRYAMTKAEADKLLAQGWKNANRTRSGPVKK